MPRFILCTFRLRFSEVLMIAPNPRLRPSLPETKESFVDQ
jgi:hypothetical protein